MQHTQPHFIAPSDEISQLQSLQQNIHLTVLYSDITLHILSCDFMLQTTLK